MLLRCGPWELDVDVEENRRFYGSRAATQAYSDIERNLFQQREEAYPPALVESLAGLG